MCRAVQRSRRSTGGSAATAPGRRRQPSWHTSWAWRSPPPPPPSPPPLTAPETAAEKRRKLLGVLEKCDEDLKTRRIIAAVHAAEIRAATPRPTSSRRCHQPRRRRSGGRNERSPSHIKLTSNVICITRLSSNLFTKLSNYSYTTLTHIITIKKQYDIIFTIISIHTIFLRK
jgi:hypothetical protein